MNPSTASLSLPVRALRAEYGRENVVTRRNIGVHGRFNKHTPPHLKAIHRASCGATARNLLARETTAFLENRRRTPATLRTRAAARRGCRRGLLARGSRRSGCGGATRDRRDIREPLPSALRPAVGQRIDPGPAPAARHVSQIELGGALRIGNPVSTAWRRSFGAIIHFDPRSFVQRC